MAQYITGIKVSQSKDEEKILLQEGYKQLATNLCNNGNVYIWYQTGHRDAITRIQFSFNNLMSNGLKDAGYTQVKKNLNEGNDGDPVYLWFYKGSLLSDVSITDLALASNVSVEAKEYQRGWQRLACDLNRNDAGKRIYLFVKREKPVYIQSVTATADYKGDTSNFTNGYIRVDENTNRGAGGSHVFIWYLLTPNDNQAIKDLTVSICDEQYQAIKDDHKKVDQDLNQGTGGNQIYLWYKQDGPDDPIGDVSVILEEEVDAFQDAKINVILKNLNTGNKGVVEYVCYTRWPADFTD